MSRALCLLLENERVYAMMDLTAPAQEFSWSPAAPALLVDALRERFGAPSSLILIVGLAFLDIAQPELPPVSNDVRVRMLQRDSDRFFALRESVAVATDGRIAFAMPAAQLTNWVDTFSSWSRVTAVLSVAQAAAFAKNGGQFAVPARAGEIGLLSIVDGQIHEARRMRAAAERTDAPKQIALAVSELAAGATRAAGGPIDLQLLSIMLRERLQRQRARIWWRSAALVAAALLLVVWSADRWRERQFAELQQQVRLLEQRTAAARAARIRLLRANDETSRLQAASERSAAPDAPLAVLARLGAVLPRDAFIQRLEWDGTEWRIDGSATDAAALVPLLDADAQFESVRSAAPSTRYIELGRPRSSFSIVFTTSGVRGGS